jgi:hypothetical protein
MPCPCYPKRLKYTDMLQVKQTQYTFNYASLYCVKLDFILGNKKGFTMEALYKVLLMLIIPKIRSIPFSYDSLEFSIVITKICYGATC